MNMELLKIRRVTWIAIFVAALCLLRAFAVQAHAAEKDIDEVYEESQDEANNEPEKADEKYVDGAREIRFSHPDEAKSRVLRDKDDPEFALVEGANRLKDVPAGSVVVPGVSAPTKLAINSKNSKAPLRDEAKGRAIASIPPAEVAPNSEITPTKVKGAGIRLEASRPSPIPVREDRQDVIANLGREVASEKPVDPSLSRERVKGQQEVSVIASDMGFFPSRIFVTEGVPVKLFLSTPGQNTLCFMVDQFGVKKGILPGHVEEVSFVPDARGDYRFYCPIKAIEGRITVRAPASQ